MWVDAVELRVGGEKRSLADVRAAMPVRADLSMTAARPGWYRGQRDAPLLAALWLDDGTRAFEPLDRAAVTQIKGFELLIVGVQPFARSRRHKDLVLVPQAWWCRLVGPSRSAASHAAAAAAE